MLHYIVDTSAFFSKQAALITRAFQKVSSSSKMASNFYDIVEKDANGQMVKFDKFKGKVVYGVNVASRCGYTASGYALLSKVSKMPGVEVALFPCNQFLGQEPGSDADVANFCVMKGETLKEDHYFHVFLPFCLTALRF
jgi:glutathione peroxidase